jgi:DnaA family protein
VSTLEPHRVLEAPREPLRAMRQIPLDLGSDAEPSLDEVVGERNQEALAWLQGWPASQAAPAPTYLWGAPGSGKTHLLRAMISRAMGLGFGVIWLNAHTCQMWDGPDLNSPTLALIDDCEALDATQQHLAFNLFIEAAAAPGMLYILAAGRVPSVDLPVRDDLRTRLGWGLAFALSALDDGGLRQALQQEAARRGLSLGDEVVSYILTRHSRDLGSLMNLLARLDRYALAEHRALTVPLLKQMLALETA